MQKLTGEVKWFNNVKGYGFLGYSGGPDVFCHYSAIERDGYKTLNAGDPVCFTIEQGAKGPQAAGVVKTSTLSNDLPAASSTQGTPAA